MNDEKTITINGQEVRMRYCAAAETGYERLAEKSSTIFVPEIKKDDKGKVTDIIPRATTDDWIKLGMAAIIAAYGRDGENPPVTPAYLLYEATPEEVRELIKTVDALRNQWYGIPATIEKSEFEEEPKKKKATRKNSPTPTKTSSDS